MTIKLGVKWVNSFIGTNAAGPSAQCSTVDEHDAGFFRRSQKLCAQRRSALRIATNFSRAGR